MPEKDFVGAKIAMLCGEPPDVVSILRDDVAPWAPNLWDLPGGGREGNETPRECLRREVREELDIDLDHPDVDIIWHREYPGLQQPDRIGYLYVARVSELALANARLVHEGKDWGFIPLSLFLTSSAVVPQLQVRLGDFVNEHAQQF